MHYEVFDILTHTYSHYGDFQNLAQIYKKNKIESFNLLRETKLSKLNKIDDWDKIENWDKMDKIKNFDKIN